MSESCVEPNQAGKRRDTKRRKAGMHMHMMPTFSSSGEKMPESMLS